MTIVHPIEGDFSFARVVIDEETMPEIGFDEPEDAEQLLNRAVGQIDALQNQVDFLQAQNNALRLIAHTELHSSINALLNAPEEPDE